MVIRFFIISTLVISLITCKSKSTDETYERSSSTETNTNNKISEEDEENYPDAKYCANVSYYNPNTETQSSYRLTVDIKNNKVIALDWPNGGRLEEDHFSGAELDEEGHTTFESDKGYNYDIQIVGKTANCFDGVTMVKQCRGHTKKGRQCRHLTDNPNGLCWQHQSQE
jgi:hypothetical protein